MPSPWPSPLVRWGWLALPITLLGCHGRKLKPEECAQMLDRYVDMTIAADPQLASFRAEQAKVVREMKKEMFKGEPRYARVREQCEAEVSRGEYDCAMAAKTPNDWEACIE